MGVPPTIECASLGMADSLILMVLALVVFGPRRLPQIGRQLGKLMYEFRKASNDFKYQMEEELRNAEEAERRKKEEEARQQAALAAPAQPAVEEASATPAYTNPQESPYPYETTYPATTDIPAEMRPETPAIQPPSTGEQVSAAAPHAAVPETPAAPETAAEASVGPHEAVNPPAVQDDKNATATEPVNHNG